MAASFIIPLDFRFSYLRRNIEYICFRLDSDGFGHATWRSKGRFALELKGF
jgi:hypothetical protein